MLSATHVVHVIISCIHVITNCLFLIIIITCTCIIIIKNQLLLLMCCCHCFSTQLSRSNDGFSVVADYFGRGVFSKVNTHMYSMHTCTCIYKIYIHI